MVAQCTSGRDGTGTSSSDVGRREAGGVIGRQRCVLMLIETGGLAAALLRTRGGVTIHHHPCMEIDAPGSQIRSCLEWCRTVRAI